MPAPTSPPPRPPTAGWWTSSPTTRPACCGIPRSWRRAATTRSPAAPPSPASSPSSGSSAPPPLTAEPALAALRELLGEDVGAFAPELVEELTEGEALDADKQGNLFALVQKMNVMQKINLARMGNKEA